MQEFALTLNLKDDPEIIRQYKEYHSRVWPEVVAAFKHIGVMDMKIFLLGRRLFLYYTAPDNFDPEVDLPAYLNYHPKCREWEALMSGFQEKVPEAQPHEKWARMEKVFQL